MMDLGDFYFLFLSFIISHSSCRFHGQKSQFNWSRSSYAEIILFLGPNSKAPLSYQKGKSCKKENLKLKSCKKKKKMSHQKGKNHCLILYHKRRIFNQRARHSPPFSLAAFHSQITQWRCKEQFSFNYSSRFGQLFDSYF